MFDVALVQGNRILIAGEGTGLAVGFAACGADVYICGRRKEAPTTRAEVNNVDLPAAGYSFGSDAAAQLRRDFRVRSKKGSRS